MGVMRAAMEIHGRDELPFEVICGTSAGAINAVFLAANAHRPREGLEALLRTWPQLSDWLLEDRDKLRLLEGLQRAAAEWEQGGRSDELLVHRDGRLKEVAALAGNPRFGLPDASVERAYLDACSAAQQARDGRQLGAAGQPRDGGVRPRRRGS